MSPVSLRGKILASRGVANFLEDRLLTRLLEQVVPKEDTSLDDEPALFGLRSVPPLHEKPAFSLPLMTANFRRFNSRIGIVFEFQRQVERLLSWSKPTHTLSFLIVYSFVCLDPYLLVPIPFAVILILIMVPSFLARHPPPPSTSTSSTVPYYSYHGPALAPPKVINPAPESSKDFFRNMRDLQNTMADFSDLHDATIAVFGPMTDFSNESISSIVFLLCVFATAILFLTAHLLPWRFIFLFAGNAAVLSIHPSFRLLFSQSNKSAPADEKPPATTSGGKKTPDGSATPLESTPFSDLSLLDSAVQISLDTYTEEREVEIFELQYRSLAPHSESHWEHFLFTPLPHDPLSPARIAGERPRGCRFFEDVRTPPGWAWKSKTWELDLNCEEWVVERMITGVGFEASGNSSDSSGSSDLPAGWVWDLPPSPPSRDEDEEVVPTLAYGDLKESKKEDHDDHHSHHHHYKFISKLRERGKSKASPRDWEEKVVGPDGMGEWRRRRWVRVVHRISVRSFKEKSKPNDHAH
ncbi:hypothetical protein MPDQ_006789 [Monascus purpureus]|uniref:TECPR1-like DysF domain-containing protein n=1 Tax=Monascus purpureus TaxID=5098 RepID=A0A507QVK5_MONPU|nr:hypothetical protein MPDQ_006789 [Monascus purpureus]